MTERQACALLKAAFERAGYTIEENRAFDEDGVHFEIDGYDEDRRVGYEYVTREAGDDWDVDGEVIAKLAERRARGDLFVLVVDEREADDAAALERAAGAFLASLPTAAKTKAGKADKSDKSDKKPTAKAKADKADKAKKPAAKAKK